MSTTTKTNLTTIDDRRPVPEGEVAEAVRKKAGGEERDAEAADENAHHDVDGGYPPSEGEGCVDCHPWNPCRPCHPWLCDGREPKYPLALACPCPGHPGYCAEWIGSAGYRLDEHAWYYCWDSKDTDAWRAAANRVDQAANDEADAADGTAEDEMRRQAEVDALGGAVPPYDVTDYPERQRIHLAAYLQWAADRLATGLADCDGPPACWLCANYPCKTYATDLPCPGGYVPVSSQAMESDPILMALARQRRAQILAQVGEAAETSVMTPLNPRWVGFVSRLADAVRAEGCDAESLRLTERLLRGMDGIDAARSVEFFRANGGYCDCEVLMNVGQ